jgi:hypothetical protein
MVQDRTTRLRQRYRKQRAVSVHHIESDDQGNAQARLLHRQPLHLAYVGGSEHVEKTADRAGLDGVGRIAHDDRSGHRIAGGRHCELPELLRQGHGAQQFFDAAHLFRSRAAALSDNGVVTLLPGTLHE